jgi:hypothetical protein
MMVSFDIDCDQLAPGHRFIARGISDDDLLDGRDGRTPPCPGVSLEYTLVPGVPASEQERGPFRFLVGIE